MHLPHCNGYLLARRIDGTDLYDATGPYPIFMCERWSSLPADLERMSEAFVSVTVVTDPLESLNQADLAAAFPDVVRPFKQHRVVDLANPWQAHVSAHHTRKARTGLRRLELQVTESPLPFLDEWVAFYAHLIDRHGIQGLARFSRASFEMQFRVPGLMMVRALLDGMSIGATLWYRSTDRAYYHLGACSPTGYRESAFHAMFWTALQWLQDAGVLVVSLGAEAGLSPAPADGLGRFKAGWAASQRTAYLCGRQLNRARYAELGRGHEETSYFPAYRQPGAQRDPTS